MPPCDHSRIATALPRIAAVHDAPHALNRCSLSRRIAILTAVRVVILVTITWLAFVPSAPAKEDGNTLRQTHVLPQDLGTALEALAKDFDFQILYPTEMVKNLKSKGQRPLRRCIASLAYFCEKSKATKNRRDE